MEFIIDKGLHSTYFIQFNLVFCVKYRRKVLTEPISKGLKGLVLEIASKFDLQIIERGHIHVLFASKPSVTMQKIRGKPGQEMIIDTRKSFKYRIYPTQAQTTTLENQMSMCRHLYNWSLAERKEVFENSGKSVTYNAQQNRRPDLKKQRPWFKSVHSQVLQDALRRLDRAYQNFFSRVKKGGTPGFPKFKKRGQWSSITYPQYKSFPERQIRVPKIGLIKTVYHRQIPKEAKIKTMSIIKQGGKWFACFCVELALNVEPKQGLPNAIGIDMGLNDFLYASNGFHLASPKYFRQSQQKLARLQRRLAKANKRTSKYRKLLKAVHKCHYRIRFQRQDFLHKAANALLDSADVICHEKLNIKGMSRRPKPIKDDNGTYFPNRASIKSGLNKSINDAGWHQFLRCLKYKTAEQGKQVIGVPAQYTSQMCCACGQIVKKPLPVRTHRCPCGFVANRDQNAALNILRVGMDTLAAKAA